VPAEEIVADLRNRLLILRPIVGGVPWGFCDRSGNLTGAGRGDAAHLGPTDSPDRGESGSSPRAGALARSGSDSVPDRRGRCAPCFRNETSSTMDPSRVPTQVSPGRHGIRGGPIDPTSHDLRTDSVRSGVRCPGRTNDRPAPIALPGAGAPQVPTFSHERAFQFVCAGFRARRRPICSQGRRNALGEIVG